MQKAVTDDRPCLELKGIYFLLLKILYGFVLFC